METHLRPVTLQIRELPNGTYSATGLFDRLVQLIERLGHEQHILKVIDLEMLVKNGVE
jgi:hypothetical protein